MQVSMAEVPMEAKCTALIIPGRIRVAALVAALLRPLLDWRLVHGYRDER